MILCAILFGGLTLALGIDLVFMFVKCIRSSHTPPPNQDNVFKEDCPK
jgi:hypothetical protein